MKYDLARFALSLAGILLFVAPGLGLVEAVRPLRRLPLFVRIAWAYLLGIAWVAGGAYAASHLFGAPLKRGLFVWLAILPALAGAAAALKRTRAVRGTASKSPRHPHDPVALAAFAAAVLICAGLYAEALRNPLTDWDGRMTWFAQARFVREARTVDAVAIRKDLWYLTNRRYPLLLPLAQVSVQETFNLSDDERTVRPLYATFFPAFLLVLWSGAVRLAGRSAAALAVLSASVVPYFAFWNHGGASGGYSDFPLACFFGAGGLLLLLSRTHTASLAAGLLLAGAALTKREGLPASVACLAVVALHAFFAKRREARGSFGTAVVHVLPALALVAAAAAFFAHWASDIVRDGWDDGYIQSLRNMDTWRSFVPRLVRAAPRVLHESFDLAQWGILWTVLPATLVLGGRALRRARVRALAALALVSPAIGLAAYGVHWDPPALAAVTWGRFLVQGSLPTFLVFAACLGSALRARDGRESAG